MDAREAYDAIRRAVRADPRKRIVGNVFVEVNFGNFIVSFEDAGQPKSVVNDRGELVLCDDFEGSKECTTAVQSLRGVDEQTLIRALNL